MQLDFTLKRNPDFTHKHNPVCTGMFHLNSITPIVEELQKCLAHPGSQIFGFQMYAQHILLVKPTQQNPYSIHESPTRHSDYMVTGQ